MAAPGAKYGTTVPPEQGQLVEVRARPWVVAQVETSTLAGPALEPGEPQHLVTLRSVEDDAEPDESLRVVWEVEPSARVLESGTFPHPTGVRRSRPVRCLPRRGPLGRVVAGRCPRSSCAPFRSGVEIDDYQLEPLVRALRMPRVGLLIADDVGLGQDDRGRARDSGAAAALPGAHASSSSLRPISSFSGATRCATSSASSSGSSTPSWSRQLRRARGIHANPWTCFPRLITSIRLAQARAADALVSRDAAAGPDEPRYPRRCDLLIVDEAHNVAPSGRGHYAIDSLRTETAPRDRRRTSSTDSS